MNVFSGDSDEQEDVMHISKQRSATLLDRAIVGTLILLALLVLGLELVRA